MLGTTSLYILGLASAVIASRVAAVPTEEARVITVRQTVVVMATEIAASLPTTTATSTFEPLPTVQLRLTRVGVMPAAGAPTATLEPTPRQYSPPARIVTPTEPPRPASGTVTFVPGTPRASGTPSISGNGTPTVTPTPGSPVPTKAGGVPTLTPTIQLGAPSPIGTPLPGGVPPLTPAPATVTPGGAPPTLVATTTPTSRGMPTLTPVTSALTPGLVFPTITATATSAPRTPPTLTPANATTTRASGASVDAPTPRPTPGTPVPTNPLPSVIPTRPPALRQALGGTGIGPLTESRP